MEKRVILLLTLFIGLYGFTNAQTEEELKAQKAEKQSQISNLEGQLGALKGEIAEINAKLLEWPRWEKAAFGVLGLNFNGFKNWLSRTQPNIDASSIGLSLNGYANYLTKKSFWRNGANINMGWAKIDDKDNQNDVDEFQSSADAINITSLYGYKFTKQFAASALAEYRSTIVNNFNNPGYLDFGVGATWNPSPSLVVVIHPLNYNLVFSDDSFDYQSSLGAKIVADFTREVLPGFTWKSNLSTFQSYKSSDLSNWTWINSLAISYFKGIGIGLEYGLRNNKQEALAAGLDNNPVQTYYNVGLSYSIGTK